MDPIKNPWRYYIVMFLFYLIPSAFLSTTFIGAGVIMTILLLGRTITGIWFFVTVFSIILGTILIAVRSTKKLYYANKEIEESKKLKR